MRGGGCSFLDGGGGLGLSARVGGGGQKVPGCQRCGLSVKGGSTSICEACL